MLKNLRFVKETDCDAILELYAYYILQTTITFELTVPTRDEFLARIRSISATYPYIVYEIGGKVIGYAYASRHAERAAYCYDVNVSIYVSQEYHGTGVAYELYECLFDLLRKQGFYNAYAGITVPNEKSEAFHKKFGFTPIGTYRNTGFKFGNWHDVIWMEKALRRHDDNPQPIKPISEVLNG